MRGGGGASHPNAAIVYTSAQYRDMYNFVLYLEKFTVKITVQYPSAAMECRLNVRVEKNLAPCFHPGSGDEPGALWTHREV